MDATDSVIAVFADHQGKAEGFLVMAHGSPDDMARAGKVIEKAKPSPPRTPQKHRAAPSDSDVAELQ